MVKKKKKKKTLFEQLTSKYSVLLLMALAGVILTPLVSTVTRYIISSTSEHYLNSREFYFTSTYLNGGTYYLYNWDGISNYTFDVDTKNSKDLLNWTKEDIPYTMSVTCTSTAGPVTCSYSGTTTLAYNAALATTGTNNITVDIGATTFSDEDTITVNVSATSSSPYHKVLTGTFVIMANKAHINYFVEDAPNDYYATLVISNNDATKNVTISMDTNKVAIDTSNYFVINGTKTTRTVNNIEVIETLTFSAVKDNVYSIRFYKHDQTQDYSLDSTVIGVS